jgi:hypothetical protein
MTWQKLFYTFLGFGYMPKLLLLGTIEIAKLGLMVFFA